MILLNTTFHVHVTVQKAFVEWLREEYQSAALATGYLTEPQLARVLGGDDPEGMSFAFQLKAPSLGEAKRWHDAEAAKLREDITKRWGQKVLFFTTYLSLVD
jgi:hypothetical protein